MDILDKDTTAVVVADDPPWFDEMLRLWAEGSVHAGCLFPSELCQPGSAGPRPVEARAAFAREIRARLHQQDLDAVSAPTVAIVVPGAGVATIQEVQDEDRVRAAWTEAAEQFPPGTPGRTIQVSRAVAEQLSIEQQAAAEVPTQMLDPATAYLPAPTAAFSVHHED
jgi:hypothetical protein